MTTAQKNSLHFDDLAIALMNVVLIESKSFICFEMYPLFPIFLSSLTVVKNSLQTRGALNFSCNSC